MFPMSWIDAVLLQGQRTMVRAKTALRREEISVALIEVSVYTL